MFVLLQAVSLSKQFTRTFYKLNATNKILQRTNVELQNKNKIIQQKNEELSKLNRELDSFVYRVTHDLRAPITSVLGIIDAAKTEKMQAHSTGISTCSAKRCYGSIISSAT